MNLIIHTENDEAIAEAVADSLILKNEQDVIFLLEELHSCGANKIIIHKENIIPEFFDLRTGLAGAILQKFVNYSMPIAIMGDFSNITSDALKAFIYESNRGKQIFFLESVEKAIQKLISLS